MQNKIAEYGFKVQVEPIGSFYQVKTDPSQHYISLALMLYNDGYDVRTDNDNETIRVRR